ncbi:hypothetical protein L202_05816 [Cryptococcus amylolentus CBS 6039]|uniref:Uncharacterized protein n=1 Tax=Cryptococcus amylolentus CBS 6039 TaxID=1295533 RepID=A0A1E3HI59_9TREE|nr:hypothetical protein L202_05816 [Cryptococcus amylolentus CBS 6039]ODN75815.1 hypothetical protein L202_05816 [Cryptococcus amylolentus CBS 6039]
MAFLSNYLDFLLSKALRPEEGVHPDTDPRLSHGDIFILAARADKHDLAKTAIERIPYYFDRSFVTEYSDLRPLFTHWWHPEGNDHPVFPAFPPKAFAATPRKYMWALMQVGSAQINHSVRGKRFRRLLGDHQSRCAEP